MLGLPQARLFTVGQASFEYIIAGTGKPAVVLINGSGGPLEGWHKVWTALAETTTTLAYNRPGVGRSSAPQRAQTAAAMVEDLRALLLALAVARPWVLVGHSYGGLVAQLFARLHPLDLAGVVLLEATAPQDVVQLKQHESGLQRGLAWLAQRLMPLHPHHETLHAPASVAEIAAAPDFPALPLKVLTGSRPAMAWASRKPLLALRARHQQELAGLCALGVQIPATRSGHFPQFTEPWLVTSVIRELLAETRLLPDPQLSRAASR